MSARYQDKAVVITGAAQGLGRAYAEGFAAEGARLILTDVNKDGLEKTAAELRAAGHDVEAHAFDVSDADAVAAFGADVATRHGEIALLINNAALASGLILDRQKLPTHDYATWMRFLGINTVAPLILGNALKPLLKAGGGSIINQTSMASTDPLTAYAVTKSALNAMTRMMAGIFGADGIRVNAIGPGLIVSAAMAAGLSQEHADMVRGNQLIDREGMVEDIVNLALFLGSNDAKFITSEVVYCDGGSHRRHWRY